MLPKYLKYLKVDNKCHTKIKVMKVFGTISKDMFIKIKI
jgi:hypothetical protein